CSQEDDQAPHLHSRRPLPGRKGGHAERQDLWVANAGLPFFSPGTGGVTVSTVDVKTRKNQRDDITAGTQPTGVAFTPDGKTAFVTNFGSGTVSTIDVKTRLKNLDDIPVGQNPATVEVTPDGKTVL